VLALLYGGSLGTKFLWGTTGTIEGYHKTYPPSNNKIFQSWNKFIKALAPEFNPCLSRCLNETRLLAILTGHVKCVGDGENDLSGKGILNIVLS